MCCGRRGWCGGSAAGNYSGPTGDRVALVHYRPYLGATPSVEPAQSPRRRGLASRDLSTAPERRHQSKVSPRREPKATFFMEYTVYNATTQELNITSIAPAMHKPARIRLRAPFSSLLRSLAALPYSSQRINTFGQNPAEYNDAWPLRSATKCTTEHSLLPHTPHWPPPNTLPPSPRATPGAKDFLLH